MIMEMGLVLLCLLSVTLELTPEALSHVHNVANVDLGFTGELALSTVESHSSTIMCVFDSWAIEREGEGEFRVDDINATLCTHLMIRSVEIEDKNGAGNFVFINKDLCGRGNKRMIYKKVAGLKKQNPDLKVILSFGGWGEGVKDILTISSDRNLRSKFGENLVNFLTDKQLDGVNVECMWPGVSYSDGKKSCISRITDFIALLSTALKDSNLELWMTLPGNIGIIGGGFNVTALAMNLDYLILMGQDLAGYWDERTGHHSPLHSLTGSGVADSVLLVLEKKISPCKVILGIPFAGRTFKLRDAQAGGNSLGAPTVQGDGMGMQGEFNNHQKDDRILSYNEICSNLNAPWSDWIVYEDKQAKVNFMKDGDGNWVSFDDPMSVQAKVEFGATQGLGGYAAWSITSDDFRGNLCGGGIKYPLLRTINFALSKKRRKVRHSVDSIITEGPANLGENNEGIGGKVIIGAGGGSGVLSHAAVTLLGIFVLLVAVLILVVWKRRGGNEGGLSNSEISRFKKGFISGAGNKKRNAPTTELNHFQEGDINCNPYDTCLEIAHTDYEIYRGEILGSGAYGLVVKGKVGEEIVAVKMPNPLCIKNFVLSLLEEIKVMTYLGKHGNILGLIGANTALLHRGVAYVFVEWCPLGSLEKYLKVNKSGFVNLIKNDEFTRELNSRKDGEGMSSETLMIWAHQISNAMQFLASKKVIHGDLATRNVLLREKHCVKVSDFGLSRKMYGYCNYIKEKQEPLPWRHMSLEALKNMEFSTKSDVWAFGVTLWEIFTLGDLPYPGMICTPGFIDELLGGLRMPKPKFATTELYENAMLQTWNENPKDRPSFDELSAFLHDAVERVSYQQEYMFVND